MSTSKKGYEKPYKFFAEDEGSSDAENDPNIPESTAKSLNLSQYMDGQSNFHPISSIDLTFLLLTMN